MGTSTGFAYNLVAGQRQLKGWILPCHALPANLCLSDRPRVVENFQLSDFAGFHKNPRPDPMRTKPLADRRLKPSRCGAEGAAKKGARKTRRPVVGIANAMQGGEKERYAE
jgi:hypothetical protein